tara:strand:+ start:3834 stop:4727 length:894 start_codon:yes stop_codon:yes gene_type:complete
MSSERREISLLDFFEIIKSKILLIISVSTLATILSFGVSFLINETYSSSILVKNNNEGGNNPLSSISSQLGALTPLAGIDFGNTQGKLTLEQIEAQIISRDFVNHLSTFEDFDKNLLAARFYDKKNKMIIYDEKKINLTTNQWTSKKNTPTTAKRLKQFKKNIRVSLDAENSFIKIDYRHLSPYVAKETLDLIFRELNLINRKKALEESNKTLEYLSNQLQNYSLKNVIQSINSLTEIELNKLVIANVKDDYTLAIIDSSYLPEKKSHPKRSLIMMVVFLLSFFLLTGYFFLLKAFS